MDRLEELREKRDFAWRCAEDDSGFALEKMDEIVGTLMQENHRLKKALRDLVRMDLTDGFSFVAWEHSYGDLLPKNED